MKEIGIYIHIPFCKKKCDYCDFVSFADKETIISKYIEKVKIEIGEKLKDNNYIVKTIYIGGGTPSFIDSKFILDIFDKLKKFIHNDFNKIEKTIEINPGTVTQKKLLDYKEIGINRLSIGLQESDDELLKSIGRIHTYNEFLETYNLARNLGFNNINIDLMIGLPDQSINNIKDTLNKIIELNPEHISTYSLIIEENTKIYERYKNNLLNMPDEELERRMYWYVKDTLENNGYIHYEISNFAKKGFESKHNMDCWEQREYLGFGVAAHSYIDDVRYSNTESLDKYIENPNNKIINEKQSFDDTKKEYMLLGLRKIDGISIQKFKNKFGDNPIFIFRNELNKLINNHLLQIDGDSIKLTPKGLDLANLVWEEFV